MWSNVILIIVAFTVLIGIYIFVQPTKSREQFAINVEQDYRLTIGKAFNIVLGRDPQEYEVQLYRDVMTSPYDSTTIENKLRNSAEFMALYTKGSTTYADKVSDYDEKAGTSSTQVVDIVPIVVEHLTAIASTASTASNNIAHSASNNIVTHSASTATDTSITSMDLGLRLDLYRMIVGIYEQNLDRLPSMKELNYYTLQLSGADKTFDSNKLTQILQSSTEYNILQKNQSNIVNVELNGSITDAQLTLQVVSIYQSMFGQDPNKSLEEFLKIKFVEYNMDEPRFRKMLDLLKQMDSDKWASIGNATNVSNVSNATNATNATNASNATNALNVVGVSVPTAAVLIVDPVPTVVPLPATVTDRSSCSITNAYNKNKFYDSLYTNMKSDTTPSPVTCTTVNERNRYAERCQDRNATELGFECGRDTKFPYDYDPNVVPQLRNTKFGTFLDDAENTSVGSIMPKFQYKEYGYVN